MNIQLKDVDNVVFNGIDVSAVKFNDVLVWRKWETIEYTGAVPVEIYANGEPLIEMIISGNMSQTGTPTPENPIMPQETGERTGNLLDENTSSDADATHINYNKIAPIILTAGQTYTFSCDMTCNGLYIRSAADDSNLASANNSSTLTYTPQVNVSTYCRVWNSNGITNLKPMLNLGSTALPYEKFGYKIPISSASTTTPIYLGEVETTRQVKKLVLTGEETYIADAPYSRFITAFPNAKIEGLRLTQVFCTHFISVYDGRPISEVPNNSIYSSDVAVDRFFIKTTDYTTAADFKAYLAQQYANGTPVVVWYVLATPQTAVVNEPLRKIGTYADTLSMEQTNIPTVEGANVVDVNTTLKPSEIYIKYKGRSS